MVEIKGFNEAYNNMLAIEAMKKIKKQTIKRRIKELIEQGVEKDIAKVMAECGLQQQPPGCRGVKFGNSDRHRLNNAGATPTSSETIFQS